MGGMGPHGCGRNLAAMIAAIAAATVREAARNRLPWLLGLLMLAAIGIGGFLRDLAQTERPAIQTVLNDRVLRLDRF